MCVGVYQYMYTLHLDYIIYYIDPNIYYIFYLNKVILY